MIDTHTHLYLEEFDEDRKEAVKRAQESGVSHLVLPNVGVSTIEPMLAMHHSFPQYTSVAMGLHPTEVQADYRDALAEVERHLDGTQYVAIGEVGIDLYWDTTYRSEQLDALTTQVQWALNRSLPLIIHCRSGLDEVIEVFSRFKELPPTVMHSFTGTLSDVKRLRQIGDFYFGVNGIVTYKKSAVPALLPEIGISRILLETDSPYLAPVPCRGRRNESANIPHICRSIATHLGMSPQEVSAATDSNARALLAI